MIELEYKDPSGKVLYGFSQENLEKTNRELRKTNRLLQYLIILVLVFMAVVVATIVWFDTQNIITRIIFGG